MATKRLYATSDFRYGTRMLRAGDPIDMTAPDARLFIALGKVTDGAPRAAPAPKPAAVRAKPRKRAAKRK